MACERDTHPTRGLVVHRGATVHADESGRLLDKLSNTDAAAPSINSLMDSAIARAPTRHEAVIKTIHDQDVVIDPAGVAYNVRVHLAQHLHIDQRVQTLEASIDALKQQIEQQQRIMHDLRRENFVTQGAFMAAQQCKADAGTVTFQRCKLDTLCSQLVAAGILEESSGGTPCSHEQGIRRMIVSNSLAEKRLHEEDIARVSKDATGAKEEAQCALHESEEAKAIVENVAACCREVDRRCRRTLTRCCGLEEVLEERSQRIETNSTRIFQLAAQVEALTARKCSGHAPDDRPLPHRHPTRDIFAVELATLRPRDSYEEARGTSTTQRVRTPMVAIRGEESPPIGQSHKQNDKESRAANDGGLQGNSERAPRPGLLHAPGEEHLHSDGTTINSIAGERVLRSSTFRRDPRGDGLVLSSNEESHAVHPVPPPRRQPQEQPSETSAWARASWPRIERRESRSVYDEVDPGHSWRRQSILKKGHSLSELATNATRELMANPSSNTGTSENPEPPRSSFNANSREVAIVRARRLRGRDRNGDLYPLSADESVCYSMSKRSDGESRRKAGNSRVGVPCDLMGTPEAGPAAIRESGRVACAAAASSSNPLTPSKGTNRVESYLDEDIGTAAPPGARHNHDVKGEFGREDTLDVVPVQHPLPTSHVEAKSGTPRGIRLAHLEGVPPLWCLRDTWEDPGDPSGTESSPTSEPGEPRDTSSDALIAAERLLCRSNEAGSMSAEPG